VYIFATRSVAIKRARMNNQGMVILNLGQRVLPETYRYP
jgi:hypothetical protein